jgi:predicted TIM-barrel fold metal-dependent hydrolase
MTRHPVIDVDGHINEPADIWEKFVDLPYRDSAPRLVTTPEGSDAISFLGNTHTPSFGGMGLPALGIAGQQCGPRTMYERRYVDGHPGGFDPLARLAVMDEEGIEIAVLFPSLSALPIAALPDEQFATALARGYNNWLTEFCQAKPQRLYGVAQVPLLHLNAAIAEATRAVQELGMRMIVLRPNPYGGRQWMDRFYDPFWACVQDLGVPIAFHEGTFPHVVPTAGADRFENFFFQHAVSHPFEQQLVCLSLLAGGVLERFPRLQVAFMESGCGWLPYWLDRIDEHYEQLEWLVPDISMKPSAYFRRQCFISTEAGESDVSYVATTLGDRILFASDFPHYDAVFPGAVAAFRASAGLTEEAAEAICGRNAARMLKVPVDVGPAFRAE